MSWSDKYKKSIDCNNPKGFSQKAHCDARKKRANGKPTKSKSPFNEMMEHCGCEDDAVKELETGLKKLNNTSYDSIDRLMRNIMKKHDMTAKQLHNAFVDKHNKTPDDWINEGTLHFWYHGSKSKKGKPGWVQPDGSPCANEPGETKTPKCFSSGRLRALKRKGKKGLALIKSAVRRKREKDKGQQQKTGASAPTNVPTFAKGKKDKNYIKAEPGIKEAMELNEAQKDKPGKGSGKKDACYHKVKSRYSVWPSAYASGALVKCRKVGAANWGTTSEATMQEEERYCPLCDKKESRSECSYGGKAWDKVSIKDHEYSMARSELKTIANAVKRLQAKVGRGEGNIEAWVQSKITKAADYIDTAADYLDSGEVNNEEIVYEGDFWHPDPEIDRRLGGPGPNQRAREDYPKPKSDPKKLRPGESYMDWNKRQRGLNNSYEPDGELIDESTRLQAETGNILAVILNWRGKTYSIRMFFPQIGMPSRKDVTTEIQKIYPGSQVLQYKVSTIEPGMPLIQVVNSKSKNYLLNSKTIGEEVEIEEDWQKVNRQDKTDGLSQAAVNAYRRENPGSKLQTAVTEKNPTGKRAKRRASFCRRMKGMKSKLTSAKTARDPDSRINKALRRWNCN